MIHEHDGVPLQTPQNVRTSTTPKATGR
jgi:hypothetical protein